MLTLTSVVAPVRSHGDGAKAIDVYSHDGANMLSPVARLALPRIYVPNSESNTVDVIDPKTYKIVEHFAVGALPQHVVPAWNLKTLYVTNDLGNSLTPINPRTGKPGTPIPVDDPYNMYFTPERPLRDRRRGAPAPARLSAIAHDVSRSTAPSPFPARASTTWTSRRTAAT